jgi:type-F conjugative transfer system pilin assembly thiol-disulfide isomerase TrbB
MISLSRFWVSLGLALSLHSYAGTLDEIRQLEAGKNADAPAQVTQQYLAPEGQSEAESPAKKEKVHPSRWYRLTDGRQVNVDDWKMVLFMQSTCQYCHRFDPILKGFSERSGLSVFPFSMDGKGDNTYPQVLPATPDVMVDFFKGGIPIATPTTFLTNVNTMETYPLLQGAVDEQALQARVDEVLRLALDRHLQRSTGGASQ